jgi:serine/threonine-protein kinase
VSRRLEIELKRSKYRLLGLVGQGQFGRVFCAVHRLTGELVALKELEQQRFPTHKFLRELRFLLSLQHPNIVTCQSLEHTSTGRCLVMDYCEGGTLRSLMSEDNHLSLPHSIKLVADILAGLEHAHHRDIVHCDLKPENILLNVEPRGWIARISDFGVARLSRELSNQEFGNTGSPAYMAPERFYGQYSPTSDLYAVGILLFELLVGRRPFSGTPADLMSAHLNQPVKIPETVPGVWHPILITALQKLSARRFQTASDMLTMLRSIALTEESGVGLDTLPLRPLFRINLTLPISPLQAQQQEALSQPIVALAVHPLQSFPDLQPHPFFLYQATVDRVICRKQLLEMGDQLLGDQNTVSQPSPAMENEFTYPSPIQALWPRPQGCFVRTRQSLYLIAAARDPGAKLMTYPVLELKQTNGDSGTWAAIDQRGRWLAILAAKVAVPDVNPGPVNSGRLSIWNLPRSAAAAPPSHLISVDLDLRFNDLVQLIALDPHHVAVVMNQGTDEQSARQEKCNLAQSLSNSLLKVFTRRGTQVGSLHLPVRVEQLIQTPIPHQLLGIDRNNPHSILLIDLKPHRILRLGIEIEPSLLLSTAWGYVVANRQGEIVCFDREVRSIGRLVAPASITAMAAIAPHGLLLATWDGQQGLLHTLDLRESNLDLLF